ncbi:MAG: hypothetical protein V1492_05215 [Candidatus Micrarchaeota archaeon]
MKTYIFALLALLAFAPLTAAVSDQQCYDTETNCIQSCCTSAGGTDFNRDTYHCDGDNFDDPKFVNCNIQCNVEEMNCELPGNSCSGPFQTCMSTCGDPENDAVYDPCWDSCLDKGYNCLDDEKATGIKPPSSGGCCGSAFVLLGVGFLLILRN